MKGFRWLNTLANMVLGVFAARAKVSIEKTDKLSGDEKEALNAVVDEAKAEASDAVGDLIKAAEEKKEE